MTTFSSIASSASLLSALLLSCSTLATTALAATDELPNPTPLQTSTTTYQSRRATLQHPNHPNLNNVTQSITTVRHVGLSKVFVTTDPANPRDQPRVYVSPDQIAYAAPARPPRQTVSVYNVSHVGYGDSYFRQSRVIYNDCRPTYHRYRQPLVIYSHPRPVTHCPPPAYYPPPCTRDYRSGINITINVD